MSLKIIGDMTDVDKYSFSKLSSIHQCPYSYDLYYNKKIFGESNGFADCGSLVHSILERYLKGELEQFELSQVFLNEFDNEVPEGVQLTFSNGFKKDLTDKYKEQCVDFLDSFEGFDDLEILDVEKNFDLLIEIDNKKIWLNGIIDVIARDKEDNYYIIDHKSKSNWKNKKELEKYTQQLYAYSIYILYTYHKFPKELWFNMFRLNEITKINFNEKSFSNTLEWIKDTVTQIETEQFFEKKPDDFYCKNLCNHRYICEKGE